MPPRKNAPPPPSSSSSAARFAPIEDPPGSFPPPPGSAPPINPFGGMQAPNPYQGGLAAPPPQPPPLAAGMSAAGPSALALPSMDPTSMPPPSLPPPAAAAHPPPPLHHFHTPDAANVTYTPHPGSAVLSGRAGSAFSQTTPSEKGKDKEEGKTGPGGHPKEAITIPIEELQLPKSIITRLAKGVLPPNTQIQANAILAMTKSATVFINHLANAANEVTALQSKKTIMPADVFRALDDIEYGFMRERVEAEFAKFNETQTSKRSAYRKKVAVSRKGSTKGSVEGGGDGSMTEIDGDTTMGGADTTGFSAAGSATGGQHRSKKAKTDGTGEGMDVDDEEQDASDPESVPNEEDDDEEEPQDEEEDDEGQEGGENEGEQDELEEREDRVDDDEALDDENNSD